MHKITDKQVEFILNDIKSHGVIIEDLQYNLLDHVCCIIENEMPESEEFYKFYESILPRFFNHELKEIQEETDKLLTFKNYYAMKNTLKISGIASAILTLLGATFKTMHWPGAGVLIVLGIALFSLVFLPLMIALKFKDEESKTDKWVLSFGMLLAIAASLGILFKVMHWPWANILMRGSVTAFVFGYVPVYFISRVRRPDLKFNTTVNSVLMMACGGMLYALFNLGNSKSLNDSLLSAHTYLQHNTNELATANIKLLALASNEKAQRFHAVSKQLDDKINNIKINLIAIVEDISVEEAKQLGLGDIRNVKDYDIVRHHFENTQGELSLTALLKDLETYNQQVKLMFPAQPEKIIAVNKLQLNNTVLGVLMHQLVQIQLHIATTENSYLSYIVAK